MTLEQTTFAAGCFWGVECVFRRCPASRTRSPATPAGITENPTYREVCSPHDRPRRGGRVTFDPEVVTFDQLLEVFWAMHDPTQVNRQGPDVGDQYRSGIFTHSAEQQAAARPRRERAQARFDRPIATEILPATTFYPAEGYHQRYYEKNGHEPYCHVVPVGVLRDLGLVPAS